VRTGIGSGVRTGFCFYALSNLPCLLDGFDPFPVICCRLPSSKSVSPGRLIGEAEFIGVPEFSIAATTRFDGDKPESLECAVSNPYVEAIPDPVALKLGIRDRQVTVVAAVMGTLDLDPSKDSMFRQTKDTKRWRLQHLDGTRSKLALNSKALALDGRPIWSARIPAHDFCGLGFRLCIR
jgi:hypothetical protein